MRNHFASYDNPLILTYKYVDVNFGGDANVTIPIAVPQLKGRGMGGRVLGGMITNITEDFTGDVTDAGLQVGIAGGDLDKYFDSGLVLDEAVDVGEYFLLEDDGAQVDIEAGRSTIAITAVAGSTTETGIGDVDLWIAWWQGTTV